jgi:hypothetical protein
MDDAIPSPRPVGTMDISGSFRRKKEMRSPPRIRRTVGYGRAVPRRALLVLRETQRSWQPPASFPHPWGSGTPMRVRALYVAAIAITRREHSFQVAAGCRICLIPTVRSSRSGARTRRRLAYAPDATGPTKRPACSLSQAVVSSAGARTPAPARQRKLLHANGSSGHVRELSFSDPSLPIRCRIRSRAEDVIQAGLSGRRAFSYL